MKLKTLIRWEQLRGKPIARLDMADADDFDTLLYVRALESGAASGFTREVFRRVMDKSPQQRERLADAVVRDFAVLRQFFAREREEGKQTEDGEPHPLSEVAAQLIALGVDAHFVMEELDPPFIPALHKALEEHRKEQMEEARIWTYLTVQPHYPKPFPHGPYDLFPFPWDPKPREGIEDKEIAAFEDFMRGGTNRRVEGIEPPGKQDKTAG